MRFKLLGRSGLRVSELCLGTMAFGEDWGWGGSKADCGRVVDAFASAGGNFIDTADKYTDGTSERFVGELIGADRDRWVLATKYTLSRDASDPNGGGNHRKSLRHALDASLERLGTDYVDVLWVHIWDFLTPIEEVMRALDDLVRAGKVLYLGISDTPAWIVAQANAIAESRGWTPFVAYQGQYSLVERAVEREIAPMCETMDLALTAWSPLGMGVLTGKYRDDAKTSDGRLHVQDGGFLTDRNLRIADAVDGVAEATGATSAQVALAWLRQRPGVLIPVVGARRQTQIDDSLGALELDLDASHIACLDDASEIGLGFPHDFIADNARKPMTFGDGYARVDDHRHQRPFALDTGNAARGQ